jgi:hypothetical protein
MGKNYSVDIWHISGMVFHESCNTGSVMEETSFRSRNKMICKLSLMKKPASPKFFDMVYAVRSSENIDKDNVEE